MKEVWIDLKHICKSYKRNKKTEKEKKKRNKNMKMDPGETIWPSSRSSPRPRKQIPKGRPSPSLISLTAGARASAPTPPSSSERKSRRWPSPSPPLLPLQFDWFSCRFFPATAPIKCPRPPLHFPLRSPADCAARPAKSLAGVHHCCGQELQNPVRPGYPAFPLRP
jgi:hypothetical protein